MLSVPFVKRVPFALLRRKRPPRGRRRFLFPRRRHGNGVFQRTLQVENSCLGKGQALGDNHEGVHFVVVLGGVTRSDRILAATKRHGTY